MKIDIRRITVEDADALEEFYAGLDPETRWLRFHAATAGLTHTQSEWFCRPDRDRHEGFIAVTRDRAAGAERVVGHLCVEPESPTRAEIALVVAHEFQGQGVGRRMVELALEWARRDGIETLTATMLIGNEPIRRLLTTLGLPSTWTVLDAGTCELEIDLRTAPTAIAA